MRAAEFGDLYPEPVNRIAGIGGQAIEFGAQCARAYQRDDREHRNRDQHSGENQK
jgi:hypothetical protein